MTVAEPERITRPAHLWVPEPCSFEAGREAADLAVSIGLPPHPEQRLALEVLLAESRFDEWAALIAAVIAGRQNIKTFVLMIAALYDLFVRDVKLSVWTAHRFRTTQEAFIDMHALILNYDHLRRRVRKISTANGEEGFVLTSGARLDFLARTSGGGRGLSGDVVTLDEGLYLTPTMMGALVPTLSARRNPQVRIGSSAGLVDSEVLRSIRDRGRAGGDRALAYIEWAMPQGRCADLSCKHGLDAVGCSLDDVELLRLANPSQDRIPGPSSDYLRSERRALPPAEYARERAGWWDDPTSALAAIPAETWKARGVPSSEIIGIPLLAVSMTPDRSTVSLVAAGRRADGLMSVETVLHGAAGDWFAEKVRAIAREQGSEVALHPGHAVGALIQDLQGVRLRTITTGEYAQSCGLFYDLTMSDGLRYPSPQPELTDAVAKAWCKASGETWRWAGDGISALVAGSMAVWAASQPSGGGKGRAFALS